MHLTKYFCLTIDSWFQYFVEAGAIAVRRVRKEDMRHVAKATGATLVSLWLAVNQNIYHHRLLKMHHFLFCSSLFLLQLSKRLIFV
jgi:hypothetical protein